jgi:UDP-N-acetyl-D-mannosaminuronic acid dehydrogenase
MKITVIGLGYIGLPVAIKLAELGFSIKGYEINQNRLSEIEKKIFNFQEKDLYTRYDFVKDKLILTNEFIPSDIYIVTVQTPVDENRKADLSYVKNAFKKIAENLKENDLIILESTVPPNSNKEFIEYISAQSNLNENEFDYVYCPETIQPGNVFFELESNSRVIGSKSEKAYNRAYQIYSMITKGKITQSSFIVAEHVKIIQNSYRDYEIAFANSLSIYCDEHNMNVHELISLANDHPRAKILSPGIGVGGHCLPVDPLFILEQSDFEPIKLSRKINEEKTDYAIKKILESQSKSVIIFGATYKANSDDIRHSPSLIVAKKLNQNGMNVFFCEPNIKEEEIEGFINYEFKDASEQKCLLVIAQKHDLFYQKRNLFNNKNVIDFVGLLDN